jgi:hypothetical protein
MFALPNDYAREGGPFLAQGIYPVAHATVGTLELSFVPLGPKDGGNSYQVIFTYRAPCLNACDTVCDACVTPRLAESDLQRCPLTIEK